MLAEATTTEISKKENPTNLPDSRIVARRGGSVAGNTRKDIENQLQRSVVTSKNAKDIKELEDKDIKKIEKKH